MVAWSWEVVAPMDSVVVGGVTLLWFRPVDPVAVWWQQANKPVRCDFDASMDLWHSFGVLALGRHITTSHV